MAYSVHLNKYKQLKVLPEDYIWLLILLQFVYSVTLQSQTKTLYFSHYNTDNGLSSGSINCLLKDYKGYLWIGTGNGLDRYDGYTFKQYPTKNRVSFKSNEIIGLADDQKDKIFISSSKEILFYSYRKNNFNVIDSACNNPTRVVTYQNYLYYITANDIRRVDSNLHVTVQVTLPNKSTYHKIHKGKNKFIWMIISEQLFRYYPLTNKLQAFRNFGSAIKEKEIFKDIYENKSGIYFATWDRGIYYYNQNTDSLNIVSSLATQVNCLFVENLHGKSPVFLMGEEGYSGLSMMDSKGETIKYIEREANDYRTHNNEIVQCFFNDSSNHILWLGTRNGLEKYDYKTNGCYTYWIFENRNNILNKEITSIVKDLTDKSGDSYFIGQWIGGVYKWHKDKNTLEPILNSHQILSKEIFCMLQGKNGLIWFGMTGGLQCYDPKKRRIIKTINTFFKNNKGRYQNKVLRMYEDSEQNIWLTTNSDGIYVLNKNGEIKNIELAGVDYTGRPHWELCVNQGKDKTIYISSLNGLWKIEQTGSKKLITNKNRKNKIPNDELRSVFVDHFGKIWVSGYRFIAQLNAEGEPLMVFSERNGYRAKICDKFIETNLGNIWAATDNYMYQINPFTQILTHFGREIGLTEEISNSSLVMVNENELLAGYNNVIVSLDLNHLNFKSDPPLVSLNEIYVNNIAVDTDTNYIEINDDDVIALSFAGLSYRNVFNNYSYKLEGFNKHWVAAPNRYCSFTNLPGGIYRLYITVSDGVLLSNSKPYLTIKVHPAFINTIWFKVLIFSFFIFLTTIFFHIRWMQIDKIIKVKENIARNLHDDIGSTLSSIGILNSIIKNKTIEKIPEIGIYFDRIEKDTSCVTENLQDIIWVIKSGTHYLEDIIIRIKEYAVKLCDAKNIYLTVTLPPELCHIKFSIEQTRNICLIFKEAINNSVKYSEGTQILFKVEKNGRNIQFQLADNGIGFNLGVVKIGNGLVNIRKRALDLDAELIINSNHKSGTSVSIILKLDKSRNTTIANRFKNYVNN